MGFKVHYVDPVSGNDAADGLSFVARRISGPSSEQLEPGDEVRIIASSDPVELDVQSEWTQGDGIVTLDKAVFQNIWHGTPVNDQATISTAAVIRKTDDTSSVFIIPDDAVGRLGYHILSGNYNLSSLTRIQFWIKTSIPVKAGQLQIRLCTDSIGLVSAKEIDLPAISVLGRYIPIVIETGALPTNVRTVAFHAMSELGPGTITMDCVRGVRPENQGGFTLWDLVGTENSFGAGGDDSEAWYAQNWVGINGFRLDNHAECTRTNTAPFMGPNYSGPLFIRRGLLPPMLTEESSALITLPRGGEDGNPVEVTGGWDRSSMSSQVGHTLVDGRCGTGIGLSLSRLNWVDISDVSFARLSRGVQMDSCNKCNLTLSQVSNCSLPGVWVRGVSSLNTFDIQFGEHNGTSAYCDHPNGGLNTLKLNQVRANLGHGVEIAHKTKIRGGTFNRNLLSAIHILGDVQVYDVHTLNNALGTASTISGTVKLDGVNDYIDLAYAENVPLATTSTLAFWMRTVASGGATPRTSPCLMGTDTGNTKDVFWGTLHSNGKMYIAVGNNWSAGTLSPVNDGNWHHIAMTRNSTTGVVEIMLDGRFQQSTTDASGVSPGVIDVIGKAVGSPDRPLEIEIDDLRVYNRELSRLERIIVWKSRTEQYDITTGLVNNWLFDETTGTTVNDSVSNNHGVLVGGAERDTVSTSNNISSSGLRATYFNDVDLTDETYARVDREVDFNWGTNSPAPGMTASTYSVRWEGFVNPLFSENYTFKVTCDDRVRLWIDDILVLDNWSFGPLAIRNSAAVPLVAGFLHRIKLEYAHDTGADGEIHLQWQSASQAFEVVPNSQLSNSNTVNAAIWCNSQTSPGSLVNLYDTKIDELVEFGGNLIYQDAKFASHHHDQIKNNHLTLTDYGRVVNVTGAEANTAEGYAWKLYPKSNRTSNYPLDFKLASIGVVAGVPVTVSCYVYRSSADVYGHLVLPGGQIDGVDEEVSAASTTTGSWTQVTIVFTPTEQGVVDVYGRAFGPDGTYVSFDDMVVTQA